MFYWLMKDIIAGPIMKLIYRPKVYGRHNVPKTGPVVLIGNHLSVVDSIFMPLYVSRKIRFLAKSDYFTGPGFKGWVSKKFFQWMGQIPVDRGGGKGSEEALNAGLAVLTNEECLALYPEGTRSPDGRMYRGRTGAARTILAAAAVGKNPLVVPVAVIGAEKMQPQGTLIPKRVPIQIVFGEPVSFEKFAGMDGDRFILRAVTDQMMADLNQISAQEFIDEYASDVKERMKAKKVDATA